jgi:hypothetical protein
MRKIFPSSYSEPLIKKVREWLGQDGCKFFVQVALSGNGLIAEHFNNGMKVRNFPRSLPECKDWNDHDLDDNWIEIVLGAIGLER